MDMKILTLTLVPHHGTKGLTMYDSLNTTSEIQTLKQNYIVIRNLLACHKGATLREMRRKFLT